MMVKKKVHTIIQKSIRLISGRIYFGKKEIGTHKKEHAEK